MAYKSRTVLRLAFTKSQFQLNYRYSFLVVIRTEKNSMNEIKKKCNWLFIFLLISSFFCRICLTFSSLFDTYFMSMFHSISRFLQLSIYYHSSTCKMIWYFSPRFLFFSFLFNNEFEDEVKFQKKKVSFHRQLKRRR